MIRVGAAAALVFVSAAVLAPGCALEGPDARVEAIADRIGPAMFQCPERVWPSSRDGLRASQVVLESGASDRAFVVRPAGATWLLEPTRRGDLPLALRTSTFGIADWDGVPTLAVSLDGDRTDVEVAELALHEGFHGLSGQRIWVASPGAARGTPYPGDPLPRYLREELERSLRALVIDGRAEARSEARFWLDRHEAEAPSDAMRSRDYDRREGSARYFELVGSVIGALGCRATDEMLDAEIVAQLPRFLSEGHDAGLEPYDLGVLAGVLLRSDRAVAWELDVEEGATPAARTLMGVTATPVPNDVVLLGEIEASVEAADAASAAALEPFLTALTDPSVVRVALPAAWTLGSIRATGFALLVEVPDEPQAVLGYSAELRGPDGPIHADAATVLWPSAATPCGGVAFYALVPAEEIVVEGELRWAATPTVSFEGVAFTEVSEDAFTWLCAP